MATAIIGVGNIGGAVARHLTSGGENVVLASNDQAGPEALADELEPLASAASVEDAIMASDAVVLALWLDAIKDVLTEDARLFEGKVVVDPSNPLGFDDKGQMIRTLPDRQSSGSVVASLLPAKAHYVKAFGTLSADTLAGAANRDPRVVLFYATDDSAAATAVEHLILAAGFEPFSVGGVADAGRIEMPGGDLHQFGLNGRLLDLDEASALVATKATV